MPQVSPADGQGVTVPPEWCDIVLRMLIRDLKAQAGRNGGPPGIVPGLSAILRQLEASAGRHPVATMAAERWISAAEASRLAGVSERSAQRLAASGRLIARKRRRDWEIDADSARDYGRDRNGGHGSR